MITFCLIFILIAILIALIIIFLVFGGLILDIMLSFKLLKLVFRRRKN